MKNTDDIFYGEVNSSGMYEKNGVTDALEFDGTVGVIRDISEQKKSREELVRAHDELEIRVAKRTNELVEINKTLKQEIVERKISNKILEEFAFATSHNLKEPLRSISGYFEFLIEDYSGQLGEGARNYIDRIQNRIHKMARLIDDLLEISQPGRHQIKPVRFESIEIIAELAQSMQFSETDSDERGNRIFCDYYNNRIIVAPLPMVLADPLQIRLVFKNLIANGLKFHKPGVSSIVRILADTSETHVQSKIIDNGIGIEKRYWGNIFKSFYQLQNCSGSGVSLALCNKIIERHDGKIWCESESNIGSTFYFTLANSTNDEIK
ncbi:hypothetical protein JW960_11075 [candidate division KSB1 bacterium]|nr:hypothetical protein [candidate division KSB1 bacterium]